MFDSTRSKFLVGTLTVLGTMGLLTGIAGAQVTADAAVTAGASDIKDQLLAVGAAVIPFAAAIVALRVGWRMAKSFVR